MRSGRCLALLLFWGVLAASAHAQDSTDAFSAANIKRLLIRVNDWQAAHPVMKPNDRNWERSTWYTGVMAAYRATGEERFLRQAMDWGRQHQWHVGTEQAGADRLFCVETWVELYILKRDKAMIEPTIQWLDTVADNSPAGAKVWYLGAGQRYADSLYGACALAMLAKATGEKKYLDTMHAFFWNVHAELFDANDGLFYRDKRFIGQTTRNGKKVFWSARQRLGVRRPGARAGVSAERRSAAAALCRPAENDGGGDRAIAGRGRPLATESGRPGRCRRAGDQWQRFLLLRDGMGHPPRHPRPR